MARSATGGPACRPQQVATADWFGHREDRPTGSPDQPLRSRSHRLAVSAAQKTGYIGTHDGPFTTPNILTAGLEDWKRVGGLRFTGHETIKVDVDPPGYLLTWLIPVTEIRQILAEELGDVNGSINDQHPPQLACVL